MSGRDWFLVGCRLFGVWVAYNAMSYFTSYLHFRFGDTGEFGRSGEPGSYAFHGFIHMLFALYLLLGTRHLAWLCYERDERLKGGGRPTSAADLDLD